MALLMLAGGCSRPASEAKQEVPKASPAPPPDESAHFPRAGLLKMEVIPDHLLGKEFMPGGNLATYQSGGSEYQQFLVKMPDAQTGAFLLVDWQKALTDPQYLAHMGGFFGMDAGRPVYVFSKGVWFAGVIGSPRQKADVIAREFAARL